MMRGAREQQMRGEQPTGSSNKIKNIKPLLDYALAFMRGARCTKTALRQL